MSWQDTAQRAQSELLQSIPERWRLDLSKYQTRIDVTNVPYECGLLTAEQLSISELTATEILQRVGSRNLTAVQVLEACAARTAIAHQLVNCLTDWFYEEGLQRAEELDAIFETNGKLIGPLHGAPVAMKDFHRLRGKATTAGFVSHRDRIAEDDSSIVATVRAEGAVFFCKTTMPQGGMALETMSNLWGRTLNPFNTRLSAGGSSGGDGALVAMRGCPIALSTDLGGSCRIPASFNGLYALRPTADRVPKGGMSNFSPGQAIIKLSAGPACRSMDDVKLMTKIINAHPRNKHDATCVPIPWRDLGVLRRKLTVGVMSWDGVVMPHRPVRQTLEYVKRTIEAQGHQVLNFEPPFDCWEASKTTFDVYYPEGLERMKGTLAESDEPLLEVYKELVEIYSIREQSGAEIAEVHSKVQKLKEQFSAAWESTASRSHHGRPIDVLLCPAAPSVGAPHGFNLYWGYTALFNLVDYPSVVMPISQQGAESMGGDTGYQPTRRNPFDEPNTQMYHPDMFRKQPCSFQIVGRPFEDEELLQAADVIDAEIRARLGDAVSADFASCFG